MTTLHAKSPCCRGRIYLFGARRRQCAVCKRTWRIRKRARGRKRRRASEEFCVRYLRYAYKSLAHYAHTHGLSSRVVRYRFQQSLNRFLKKTPWPRMSARGPLIVIADALMLHTEGRLSTLYLIALKPLRQNVALITPPYFGAARENDTCWLRAFAALPLCTTKRIICLVSDGKRGLRLTTKRYGWLLQRCHFHALGSFERRLSARGRTKDQGWILHTAVITVLRSRSERNVRRALQHLATLACRVKSRMLRQMIKEFITHHASFRTYLRYPQYCLPTTTGSLESLNSLVREFLRRTRGFSSSHSLLQWISGFLKYTRRITCNSSKFQPK